MNNSTQYLISNLGQDELDTLILNGKKVFYKKDMIIINEGEFSDSAYIINSGMVKIFLSDEQGKEIVLSELKEGECFGEMALIDKNECSATAMAMQNTELTVISQKSFNKCLLSNPEISARIMLGLVTKLREANKKISGLVFLDAHERVARMLLALAKEKGEQHIIYEKPTQQHMANVVGVSREMISRIIKNMIDNGHIKINKKQIVLNRSGPFL